MNRRDLSALLWIMLLPAMLALCAACGAKQEEAPPPPQPVILEPGLAEKGPAVPAEDTPAHEPEPAPAEDEFPDLGRASTLDDLMANKEKIHSYYFEHTLNASYGDIFVQTWYANGRMKTVSTYEDGEEIIEYYDCKDFILVSHAPAVDDFGMLTTFEEGDPEIPKNHLDSDYHQYRVIDSGNIGGQTCRVLESRQGEKLWVSTKHGFPLQREYTDPAAGEHFIVSYENIIFNQTGYEDVAIPDDLIFYLF